MSVLKNSKHERFAQMVAGGKSASVAYRKVYGVTRELAEANACRVMDNDGVKARIREIKERTAELIELSKAQLLDLCAEIITTPGDKIKPGTRIIQGVFPIRFGKKIIRRVEIMSKMDALREIAKMCGYYEAEKHNCTITNVGKLVRGIMHGKE